MKKYWLFGLLFFLCYTTHSQVLLTILFGDKLSSENIQFGLEGGVNWSNISNTAANQRHPSFNIGYYFDIRLKNQWFLNTGVLVKATLGEKGLSTEELQFLDIPIAEQSGTYTQVSNYFILPVLFKYSFKNRIYIEAGPQGGLLYSAYVRYKADTGDKEANIKFHNKDQINIIDAGFTVGTGFKLTNKRNSMTLGIKYYQGLTHVYKANPGTHNNSIFAKLNIPIGGTKKKEPKTTPPNNKS